MSGAADELRGRVVVRPGCAREPSPELRDVGEHDRVFCLHDPRVVDHARRAAALFGADELIPVPGGEAAKQLGTVARLCDELRRRRATRRSLLVNVGGGVLTDLGGFVAATYMRGIDCVHVPTTLLGMCDAALGGKTGVNLGPYKNLVGAFHPPRLLLVDPRLLDTLPGEQLREGLVEVVKMAAILDAGVLGWLEENLPRVLDREPDALLRCVEQAVAMKLSVVARDLRESGPRALLNFGHTVGHALEALAGFRISHGRAVSLGMIHEMRMADSQGLDRVRALLQTLDMPVELDAGTDLDALWDAMRSDKKNVGDAVRIAAPLRAGEGRLCEARREQLCP